MIEFAVDCAANAIQFFDPMVMDRGYGKELQPGSYTVRISGGAYSPFADGRDAEPSIMLWFLHDPATRIGRHRDRNTNVVTHSQFRSLAGLGDSITVDVYERTFLWAFWFDEFGGDNSGEVELTIDSDSGRETVTVSAARHSVSFPDWATNQERMASVDLPLGTHVIRIERGEFSFFPDGHDPEPFVMLWASGGRQADVKTGVETLLTVRTLNGYGDALVLKVTQPTTLRAFFLDSGPADNSGSVVVRVLQDEQGGRPYRALLVDGQSEHRSTWKGISARLKAYLEQTGLFRVDHFRTTPYMPPRRFEARFSNYDVVILNYSSQVAPDDFTTRHEQRRWPPGVEAAFEDYVSQGGGVVIVHSANNAFPHWEEYNKIIGLGGWYGRGAHSGPFVYYAQENGQLTLKRDPAPEVNICGGHPRGVKPYAVETRQSTHPIVSGLPPRWMHAADELYQMLRGPAENLEILATAHSDAAAWDPPTQDSEHATGRHEPLLMAIRYGKGRIFHSALGHTDLNNPASLFRSIECVGFITTYQRGAEWAASGGVTQPVPDDFPTETDVRTRQFGG